MGERYFTLADWEMHGFEPGDRIDADRPWNWRRPLGNRSVVTRATKTEVHVRDYTLLDLGADLVASAVRVIRRAFVFQKANDTESTW